MALPKKLRLHRAKDIEKVFRRSFKLEAELFFVRVHRKTGPPGRVMVVVPKKVSKSAVLRNRLRRRTLEEARKRLKPESLSLDLAFTIKPAAASAARGALIKDLNALFGRLR